MTSLNEIAALNQIATTEGTTTDSAVVSDANGSLSGKLRGLVKILADIWDSGNHRIKVDGSGVTQSVSGILAGQTFIFKPIQALAITAATPQAVWTPAGGKKFRLLGYHIGTSTGTDILFEDDTGGGNEFLRIPRALTTNYTPVPANLAPLGYLSTLADNKLYLDVTNTATLNGFVYGLEES